MSHASIVPCKAGNRHIDEAISTRPHFRSEIATPLLAIERIFQMRALYDNWILAIADRIHVSRSGRLLVYNVSTDQGSFPLIARRNGYDVRTINELWIGRVYDRWYRFAAEAGVGPRSVIDLGANCGYFTVLASALGATHIVAVEPEPSNLAILRANSALNKTQAVIVPAAIMPKASSTPTTLNQYANPRLHSVLDRSLARLDSSVRKPIARIDVHTSTLTDIFQAHFPDQSDVDLLKVDIEGLEWEVLSSLDDKDLGRIRCIVVESDDNMPTEFSDRLSMLGFRVHSDPPFWAATSSTSVGKPMR